MFKKYLITGILTVIPIWVTWMVVTFVFNLMSSAGKPISRWLIRTFIPDSPNLTAFIESPTFQSILAFILVIAFLLALGWLISRVAGKQLLGYIDLLFGKIPLIGIIYTGSKKILESFQKRPDENQKVVLINYPSKGLKAIGLLTRTTTDSDTGDKLAVVYVPTTPNPTSGYLEIVPYEDVIFTDWPVNDAISFIVSGGMVGPNDVNYSKSVSLGDILPKPDDEAKGSL